MILDESLHHEQDIDNLLSLYESFHILNAHPAKWSKELLFKCNSTMYFKRASCQHVVLAGMVVDDNIKMPGQYDGITLQSLRKGREACEKVVKKTCCLAVLAQEFMRDMFICSYAFFLLRN